MKEKHKIHLSTSSLMSACGILYPIKQTPFLQFIDCKRCKASYEYTTQIKERRKKK